MSSAQPGWGSPDPGGAGDDSYWRRPADGAEPDLARPTEPKAEPRYSGPPRATPPPPSFSTPVVVPPTPARELPEQDPATLDLDEARARTFTASVGMVAAAVMLILIFILCANLLS